MQNSITRNKKNGFFSKALPGFGHIANILSMFAGAFITYMSLNIASTPENDKEPIPSSKTLSVIGTILNSIITSIIYIYSNATEALTDIGHDIDKSIARRQHADYEILLNNNQPSSNLSRHSRIFIWLCLAGCITTNVAIISNNEYQEGLLLIDKYLDLYPELTESEKERDRMLLRWFVLDSFVAFAAYTIFAFQTSFAIKLVNNITPTREINQPLLEQYDIEALYGGNNLLFRRQIMPSLPLEARLRNSRPRYNSLG